MDRKIKVGSISAGLALVALPLGGWVPALLAAGAGYLIGDKQFPKGEKPWRDIQELLNEKEHGRLEFKETLGGDSKRKSPYDNKPDNKPRHPSFKITNQDTHLLKNSKKLLFFRCVLARKGYFLRNAGKYIAFRAIFKILAI